MRRREQGFTLIEIMVVIAIIAGLIGTVVVVVPQMQERQKRLTCQQNLNQLGSLFSMRSMEKPGKPKYDGVSLFLSWRKTKDLIQGGKEDVLLCPGDYGVKALDSDDARKAYDDIDLANPPTDMCSYAVRDFTNSPIPAEKKDAEILACDRQGPDGKTMHHNNGINVVYDDGQVKFFERGEIGISPDEPIVVGADAKYPMLKKVIYAGKKKD